MKKLILVLFIIFYTNLFVKPVYADLVNPDYFLAGCNSDEVLVECSNNNNINIYENNANNCNRYDNDPSYRLLSDSYKGNIKYCYKPQKTFVYFKYHLAKLLPLVIITILLELIVAFIILSKNRNVLFGILLVNLFTVSTLYLVTFFWDFSGIEYLLISEFFVIVVECTWYRLMYRGLNIRKIIQFGVIANLTSLIVGTILYVILENIFTSVINYYSSLI